jgi:NADH-quinone oxidoreductase subunit N
MAASLSSLLMIPDTLSASPSPIIINAFSRLFSIVICAVALLSTMSGITAVIDEKIERLTEYYFLQLMTVAGALIMVSSVDFLTIFIGLEVASLSVYCLCGSRVFNSGSAESSIKYFLMGCFASAFFLYGVALWYGATGGLSLVTVETTSLYSSPLVMASFIFLLIGLAFKVGLAPFHFWVPDVYQGAPTSVTTFMSCVIKAAAIGTLIKIAVVSFSLPNEWATKILWVIAVLAMTLGNLAALRQSSIKRMLAYSSVAQAGYMLIGLAALAQGPEALAGVVFYLVAYCVMSIGAFATLSAIGPDADELSDVKGLGYRNRGLAICATLFFLGLAGLPPSISGLVGKVYLFTSALSTDLVGLAIIAALNTALSCAYYFKVPMAIWFQKDGAAGTQTALFTIPATSRFAITFCAFIVVLLGVAPEKLYTTALIGIESLLIR